MQTLNNDILSISVDNHGAELTSINKNGVEYLWQADPVFWKTGYTGEFKDRDWINTLAPGEDFNASYIIRIF